MKTFSQFVVEADNTLKMTRLYHGTDSSAAQNIKKTGFKSDVNVTRQMRGAGVYVTPNQKAANMYANVRGGKRGTTPSRLEVVVPSKSLKGIGATTTTGGLTYKQYTMNPSYANKKGVQSTNQIRTKNPSFPHSSSTEVQNRFRSNLADTNSKRSSGIATKPGVVSTKFTTTKLPPTGTTITMSKAKLRPTNTSKGPSMSASQRNSGDATPGDDGRNSNFNWKRYNVGAGQQYGISGIKLADSYDIYDIILSHLLDEGYADTQESALAIMTNMSEDWRESIVEEQEQLPRTYTDYKSPAVQASHARSMAFASRLRQIGVTAMANDNPKDVAASNVSGTSSVVEPLSGTTISTGVGKVFKVGDSGVNIYNKNTPVK